MRYSLNFLAGLLRTGHKRAQVMLYRELLAWIRIEFLGFADGIGLLAALREPKTLDELAADLKVSDRDLLSAALEVGASVGELRNKRGRWSLRGVRARALADSELQGMAGLLGEAVSYDADVYRALALRLRGAERGDYLADSAETVARASRLAELLLVPLVQDLIADLHPASILDVGCGSGTYLRAAARASSTATIVGIDIEPSVVASAKQNLEEWGLSERCSVWDADIMHLPSELSHPWDLIFLFQNIYYFPRENRPGLLSRLRQLTPNGAVVIATAVSGMRDPFASHLDVVLRSTRGNYPLPPVDELQRGLKSVGFSDVRVRRLAPRQPLKAFVAR